MKKKFISLSLVFIFSFGLISGATQEKTEAISIVGGIGIAKIIGMLLGGATLIAGGAIVGDAVINPDDNHEFTDWLKNEYSTYIRDHQQLPGQPPPPPHELTPMEHAALTSLLTQQGIEVGTELYETLYNSLKTNEEEWEIPDPGNIVQTLQTNITPEGYHSFNQIYMGYEVVGSNGYYRIPGNLLGKYAKVSVRGSTDYFYIHFGDYGYSYQTYYYPMVKIILRTNQSFLMPYSTYTAFEYVANNLKYYWGRSSFFQYGSISYTAPDQDPEPEITVPYEYPDYITLPEELIEPEDFTPTFKGLDLSPLSGLVSSNQEMIDIITGAKQVSPARYQEIENAWNEVLQNYLKNPNFTGNPTEPVEPKVNPTTGLVDYEDLPDQPDTDPENEPTELTALNKALYWLKGIWYGIRDLPGHISDAFSWLKNWINTFWTKVNTLIDDFWMRFSTWWQDNFVVHWTQFVEWITGLPGLISTAFQSLFDLLLIPLNALWSIAENVWEWLQGLPELLLNFFIPPANSIGEVWDPLILLWNDKLEPVKEPLDQLLFYETELKDISAHLEFNGIGGTYKIIDYQYVKSVKDQVKGIIRAFFWILIIFFNVDQVHRLIRNQGIIKSYVRKMEEPGGKS